MARSEDIALRRSCGNCEVPSPLASSILKASDMPGRHLTCRFLTPTDILDSRMTTTRVMVYMGCMFVLFIISLSPGQAFFLPSCRPPEAATSAPGILADTMSGNVYLPLRQPQPRFNRLNRYVFEKSYGSFEPDFEWEIISW